MNTSQQDITPHSNSNADSGVDPGGARLVADIGGTNARFALVGTDGEIQTPATLPCADYPGPEEAIRAFLAARDNPAIRELVMAVATPVRGDRVAWTNRPEWSFSISALRNALALDRFRVINDFVALALSLPQMTSSSLHQVGGGSPAPDEPHALIGPGTGLGVSGLVPYRGSWIPIDGEGGHVAISPVTERERAAIAILARRYGRVSTERVLTGAGLVALYGALAELHGVRPDKSRPDEITASGLNGQCGIAAETLSMFCAFLATTAANLALTVGALGGVYIGGGIVPRLGRFFDESGFRERFESAGRMSGYLAEIPTYVIQAEYPALTGAAMALER